MTLLLQMTSGATVWLFLTLAGCQHEIDSAVLFWVQRIGKYSDKLRQNTQGTERACSTLFRCFIHMNQIHFVVFAAAVFAAEIIASRYLDTSYFIHRNTVQVTLHTLLRAEMWRLVEHPGKKKSSERT